MNKLIVDIGNTNIKFGFFQNDKLIDTKMLSTKEWTPKDIKQISNKCNLVINKIFIGSVVTKTTNSLSNSLTNYFSVKPCIIKSKDFAKEFNLTKFNVNEIGTDILAFALMIKQEYKNGVGISFGTASFAIAINNKAIKGVVIAPSIELGIHQLNQTTSLIKTPHKFDKLVNNLSFGNNTSSSLNAGAQHMAYGFVLSVLNYAKAHYHIHNAYITGGKTSYLASIKDISEVKTVNNAVLWGYYYLSKLI